MADTQSDPALWTQRATQFLAAAGADDLQPWDLLEPEADEDAQTVVERLATFLEEAQTTWPELALAPETFLDYLATMAAAQRQRGHELQAFFRTLRAPDLYLACACAQGDSKAIGCFEETIFQPVFGIVTKRLNIDPARFEEVKQATHNKLFVADPGETPKIASYSGQGKLFRWVEVVFTRAAMKMIVRKDAKEVQLEDQVMQQLNTDPNNPELHFLKTTYKGHFKAAFAESMEALSAKERNTLRYFYVDGLNIDKIGAIHGVHRATVARWLNQIRDKLFRDTRKRLTQRMQITDDEVESVLGLIQSQLELSMRLFFTPEDP